MAGDFATALMTDDEKRERQRILARLRKQRQRERGEHRMIVRLDLDRAETELVLTHTRHLTAAALDGGDLGALEAGLAAFTAEAFARALDEP